MPPCPPDPVARSRREAILVGVVWVVAMTYSVAYCGWFGYDRTELPAFVLGFPAWVFWGIVVPWLVCVAFSFWLAFAFMSDEPLGGSPGDETTAEGPPNDA